MIRNINFEDVRIDDIEEGQLLNLRVFENPKYTTGPGRNIENVLFKNITYTGTGVNKSIIEGFNKERKVKNITFENLRINGKLVLDVDNAGFKMGKFVEGMMFKK